MRKGLLAVVMMFAASAALAGVTPINIGWDDAPSRGGAALHNFDCDVNSGRSTFVVTLTPAVDHLGVSVVHAHLLVEFGTPGICDSWAPLPCVPPPLPPWWDFSNTGCHAGALYVDADFQQDPWSGSTTVQDPWGPFPTVTSSYQVLPFTIGPESTTIGHLDVEITPSTAGATIDLLAGQEYYMLFADVQHTQVLGPESCEGCCLPVKIAAQSIGLLTPGNPVPTTYGESNLPLGWNSFNPVCAVVPVRHATWGELKTRYH